MTDKPQASAPPPGWYTDAAGTLRWWDGSNWGAAAPPPAPAAPTPVPPQAHYSPAPAAPVPTRTGKSLAAAYVLAIFLGGFSAHNWYLGRHPIAGAQLALWLVFIITQFVAVSSSALNWLLWVGILSGLIWLVWWIVDLATMAVLVRKANEKIAP